jgi:hypothetical protein
MRTKDTNKNNKKEKGELKTTRDMNVTMENGREPRRLLFQTNK